MARLPAASDQRGERPELGIICIITNGDNDDASGHLRRWWQFASLRLP